MDSTHTTVVIFGASGDLAKKKTYPALFSLFKHNKVPHTTSFVGTARSEYTDEKIREKVTSEIKKAETDILEKFKQQCTYVRLPEGYNDAKGYAILNKAICDIESKSSAQKKVRTYYIALPPSVFQDVAQHIKAECWPEGVEGRLIVEKPYGKDKNDAKELSKKLDALYEEKSLYRIDHYLGKDSLQTLLPIRFSGNPLIESIWNNEHVAYVTVNFKEKFGAEGRGGYFDEFGIIRDVMENHLMQWIILAGMEAPKSLNTQDIHDAKIKFIHECQPIDAKHVFTAQYGDHPSDKEKRSYRSDETVADDSVASTFASAIMYVDNPRWKGVPFIIRCGKALDEARAELTLHFKKGEKALFSGTPSTFSVSEHPKKAIGFSVPIKKFGEGFVVQTAPCHTDPTTDSQAYVPEAYEALIYQCIIGDKTWFVPKIEAEDTWRVWDGAVTEGERKGRNIPSYEYGSTGPKEEAAFLKNILGFEVSFGEKKIHEKDFTKILVTSTKL